MKHRKSNYVFYRSAMLLHNRSTLLLIPHPRDIPRRVLRYPIFEVKELTVETVYCRSYNANDADDTAGWRMRFSFKYGGVIISVIAKPKWLYP